MNVFYDTPVWVSLPLFVGSFLLISWAILLVLRPWVRRVAIDREEWDRVLGYAIASFGVFYGLTLALIAVSVYENYSRVDTIVLAETSALATLYRDVSGYPELTASALQDLLRSYTQNVLAVDWPQQRENIIPGEGDADVKALQDLLFAFNPTDTGEQALHGQTINRFNEFVAARRSRINETTLALPALLWFVLGVGALLNAALIALIDATNLRIHLIMSGLVAIFVALVIFATATLDHPYAGVVSIDPRDFEVLLNGLMAESD